MRQSGRRIVAVSSTGMLAFGAALGGLLVSQAHAADVSAETATLGWATQGGGTSGGSGASAAMTFTVRTRAELVKALDGIDAGGKKNRDAKKIIKWVGSIDMTGGKAYTSHDDQSTRGGIKVSSNTTIIGQGADAVLPNGWFKVAGVENVIIRNIKVVNPCDLAPTWDPNDAGGNYNSSFDGMTIDKSKRVWIDHVHFTDAPKTDDTMPLGNKNKSGETLRVQCHDGSLDIKGGSDFVTVSNSIFEKHSKNSLVGSSDSATGDDGHLTITFAYNHFRDIAERSPRVRFGKVHMLNNYFTGSRTDPAYPHKYSIGTGKNSKIISTGNVLDIAGVAAGDCTKVVLNPELTFTTKPKNAEGAFVDTGSTANGAALKGCTAPTSVGWTVPYSFSAKPASAVPAYVVANAGTGKL